MLPQPSPSWSTSY